MNSKNSLDMTTQIQALRAVNNLIDIVKDEGILPKTLRILGYSEVNDSEYKWSNMAAKLTVYRNPKCFVALMVSVEGKLYVEIKDVYKNVRWYRHQGIDMSMDALREALEYAVYKE